MLTAPRSQLDAFVVPSLFILAKMMSRSTSSEEQSRLVVIQSRCRTSDRQGMDSVK